ncbi:DNA cytosine methyltransferase [Sphaerisporangium sp. TRM90804]|uniref:DNA cytosine methyltransferase n=1 Tax=Sphaerisporangium sp. TRM90804 TaxID=3031113 RepID=UPI002449B779|nr:DNA cytosine methyltransferase [Sphaerisporangium sp. TRM90804]MDH2430316.1 DNA cytosine methyltransferase [Sphaerisporangium sp. TRM90804]
MTGTIRTIDLFAGAGGLAQGFRQSGLGYETVFAVEIDPAAARTFKQNFGCPVYDGPIEEVLDEDYPQAEVIIGGPPCQGFSPLGRDRDDASRAEINELWQQYLRAVRLVRPKAFVIENVPEFQKSAQFARLLELMETDEELRAYRFGYGVLNAADYGVPQNRKRGIFVAVRGVDEVPWPPKPTHGPDSPDGRPYVTLHDTIADLPEFPKHTEIAVDDAGRQDLHIRRTPTQQSLDRYRAIPPGGNRFDLRRNRPDLEPRCWANKPTGTTDVMGRLWWDRPSVTIRTEFYKPEKGRYLHPVHDRPITHREAARIQSFPDEFVFVGSKIEVARQIGNAVPPLLGEKLARFIYDLAFASEHSEVDSDSLSSTPAREVPE